MGTFRTAFAVLVVFAHLGIAQHLMEAQTAVEAFYVCSGFYMAMMYREKYAALGPFVFWANRYARLAPTYILVAAIAYLLFGNPAIDAAPFKAVALIVLSHLTMIGQDVFLFLSYDPTTYDFSFVKDFRILAPGDRTAIDFLLVPQGWTLGVEVWFYLSVPFLLMRSTRVIAVISVFSIALHAVCSHFLGLQNDPWTYRFFPFLLGLFLWGSLAYFAWKKFRAYWPFKPYRLVAYFLMALFVVFYSRVPLHTNTKEWVFLVMFAAALPGIFDLTGRLSWDRAIGNFSFPIYISHLFCFSLMEKIHPGSSAVEKIALTFLVSAFIVYAMELPIDRMRARLTKGAALKSRLETSEEQAEARA